MRLRLILASLLCVIAPHIQSFWPLSAGSGGYVPVVKQMDPPTGMPALQPGHAYLKFGAGTSVMPTGADTAWYKLEISSADGGTFVWAPNTNQIYSPFSVTSQNPINGYAGIAAGQVGILDVTAGHTYNFKLTWLVNSNGPMPTPSVVTVPIAVAAIGARGQTILKVR
jgi:hypothetical protein